MEKSRKRRWLHVPSPAMIVACVALFVALGGTSYAAVKLPAKSVGTKQLKNGAVTTPKVKNGAVTVAKLGAIPGARVRDTVTTTLNGVSSAWLSWNAVDYNVGGVYSAATPTRLTAPVAGRYLIMAEVRWDADPAGRRTIALELNGNEEQIARSNLSAHYTGNPVALEQTTETVFHLDAGDYVEVLAFQDTGGPLNLMTGTSNGVTFSMSWLAP